MYSWKSWKKQECVHRQEPPFRLEQLSSLCQRICRLASRQFCVETLCLELSKVKTYRSIFRTSRKTRRWDRALLISQMRPVLLTRLVELYDVRVIQGGLDVHLDLEARRVRDLMSVDCLPVAIQSAPCLKDLNSTNAPLSRLDRPHGTCVLVRPFAHLSVGAFAQRLLLYLTRSKNKLPKTLHLEFHLGMRHTYLQLGHIVHIIQLVWVFGAEPQEKAMGLYVGPTQLKSCKFSVTKIPRKEESIASAESWSLGGCNTTPE